MNIQVKTMHKIIIVTFTFIMFIMSGIFLNVLLILTHLITATTLVRYYYPPFCEKTEAKRGCVFT